jgi:hypothetical protein
MKSIDAIAREQNVRIEDMAIETFADPLDREDWRDQSACSGDDITLGVYDNPEWRAASFFHELGHILEDRSGRSLRPTFVPGVEVLGFWLRRGQHLYPPGGEHLRMWDYELWAWEMGLLLAAREGYRFSDETLGWCDQQLETYIGWEEREVLEGHWHPPDPERTFPVDLLVKAFGRPPAFGL